MSLYSMLNFSSYKKAFFKIFFTQDKESAQKKLDLEYIT